MFVTATTGDCAHEKLCTIIHSPHIKGTPTLQFDTLLRQLAHATTTIVPGTTIVDCSILSHPSQNPALYCLWITPIITPSIFSLTCVSEHLRNQMMVRNNVVMSIFNESGDEGDNEVGVGTYMAVFKKVDTEKLRCYPVNLSTLEKKALWEHVQRQQKLYIEPPVADEK